MISSTGKYWSTGISVRYLGRAGSRDGVGYGGWGASLRFLDDGFCSDEPASRKVSTEGEMHTRYAVRVDEDCDLATALDVAVSTLREDAERLGIEFKTPGQDAANLYYEGDGESGVPPPDGWEVMLSAQASRMGWASAYDDASAAVTS